MRISDNGLYAQPREEDVRWDYLYVGHPSSQKLDTLSDRPGYCHRDPWRLVGPLPFSYPSWTGWLDTRVLNGDGKAPSGFHVKRPICTNGHLASLVMDTPNILDRLPNPRENAERASRSHYHCAVFCGPSFPSVISHCYVCRWRRVRCFCDPEIARPADHIEVASRQIRSLEKYPETGSPGPWCSDPSVVIRLGFPHRG